MSKIITTNSPPFNSYDVPDDWALVNGRLHIKGKPVIGSANKAGVRYPKQRINGHRYPIALIVYVMANWREPWPAFGVRHFDPSRPSDTLDRADNIVPATQQDLTDRQEAIHEAQVSGGAWGGHLSNNSETLTAKWASDWGSSVDANNMREGLRAHRDNEHERAVNGLRSYVDDEKELTDETRKWLEMCKDIVGRRAGWPGYDGKGFPRS